MMLHVYQLNTITARGFDFSASDGRDRSRPYRSQRLCRDATCGVRVLHAKDDVAKSLSP